MQQKPFLVETNRFLRDNRMAEMRRNEFAVLHRRRLTFFKGMNLSEEPKTNERIKL